jgi:hypothetical protein
MFGPRAMSTQTSPIFGLFEAITQITLRKCRCSSKLMLLLSLLALRLPPMVRKLIYSDWGRDTQIIIDLVLSPDRSFGNISRLERQARDGSGVAILLSGYFVLRYPDRRNDFISSNSFPHPRWGQGAFRMALEALYTSLTQDPRPLNIIQFGKPSAATFKYAEHVLMDGLDDCHDVSQLKGGRTRAALHRVYMLGDNPDSGTRPQRNNSDGQIFAAPMNLAGSRCWSEREILREKEIALPILRRRCLVTRSRP